MGLGFGLGLGLSRQQSIPRFSAQQRNEIVKLATSSPGFSCQGPIGQFLDRWLLCEVIAKKLIMYHKKSNELPTHWNYIQVTAAAKHFAINLKPEKNQAIFKGGHGKRGENTPRQLRNGYLHSLSTPDADEIIDRSSYLTSLLDDWLVVLKKL
jgi:hypothetical protein